MEIETASNSDDSNLESSKSGIHWGASLGGAAAAAAVSLILMPLGTGLGFSSFSVFTATGASAVTFTAGLAIWLVIMQWVSSGIGGYVAGRLRVKWADLHTDEVFFRDTAHGFLAWAVATIVTVALIACATLGTVHAGVDAAATVASGGAGNNKMAYYADSLYRGSTTADVNTAEAGRILATEATGSLTSEDKAYLVQNVVAHTGVAQPEAEARVDHALAQIDDAKAKAAKAAETARKTTVGVSFALALSLLIGAFIASVAAALGGRLRDKY